VWDDGRAGVIDLTGLNAMVTGGNGGIGPGMATGMAKAGANIAIWARDAAKSAEAVAGLEKLGVRALALTCDVADEAQVADAMERTVAELGPLGCLVANSGTSGRHTVVDSSPEDWRRIMNVNLDGAFLTCREAARRFLDQGTGGSLVLVSSMISRFGGAGQSAYAASKTGVLGFEPDARRRAGPAPGAGQRPDPGVDGDRAGTPTTASGRRPRSAPRYALGRPGGVRALAPRSISAVSARVSRTAPSMTIPAHPFRAARSASWSPTRAQCNDAPPSTTSTAPPPGSATSCRSSAMSSWQRRVRIGPSNSARPPYCRSCRSQLTTHSPRSSM
jgi:NAD(P)-dependent dehydrogenase (short-subunit alcohol dehydrogenase family)